MQSSKIRTATSADHGDVPELPVDASPVRHTLTLPLKAAQRSLELDCVADLEVVEAAMRAQAKKCGQQRAREGVIGQDSPGHSTSKRVRLVGQVELDEQVDEADLRLP